MGCAGMTMAPRVRLIGNAMGMEMLDYCCRLYHSRFGEKEDVCLQRTEECTTTDFLTILLTEIDYLKIGK